MATAEISRSEVPKPHYVQEQYNKYVNWMTETTASFGINNNTTVEKVAKVFFTLLASIILLPLAVCKSIYKWVKENVLTQSGTSFVVKPTPDGSDPKLETN